MPVAVWNRINRETVSRGPTAVATYKRQGALGLWASVLWAAARSDAAGKQRRNVKLRSLHA
jgi:hypothetical protein